MGPRTRRDRDAGGARRAPGPGGGRVLHAALRRRETIPCPNPCNRPSPSCARCCWTRSGWSAPSRRVGGTVSEPPPWRRVELRPGRPAAPAGGCRWSRTTSGRRTTTNEAYGDPAAARCRPAARRSRSGAGTSRPSTDTVQLRVTKKGAAQVHRAARARRWRLRSRRTSTTAASRGCSTRRRRCCASSASPTRTGGSSPAGRPSTARSRRCCARSTPCSSAVPTSAPDGGPTPGGRPRLRQRVPHVRRVRLADDDAAATSRSSAST